MRQTSKGNKTMSAAKGKAITVVEEEPNLPAVYDYGSYEDAGFEGTTQDDFAAPFFYIIQPTSPIVLTNDEARPGMLLNGITGEIIPAERAKTNADKGIFHDGIALVVCYRRHAFVERTPRDKDTGSGGNFVKEYTPADPVVEHAKATCEFGKLKTKAGNDLIETFFVFGLRLKPDGDWEHAILAFQSTKIRVYKLFMTQLTQLRVPGPNGTKVKPPLFAHRLRLTTKMEKNDQGTFYNYELTFDGNNAQAARIDPASDLFRAAADFWETCKEGMTDKVNYEAQKAAASVDTGADDVEIPF